MQSAPHAHTPTQQQQLQKQKHIFNLLFIIQTEAKKKAMQGARRKNPPHIACRRRRINHEKCIVPVGCLRHVLLCNHNKNIANECVGIINK